jgi:O-antigen/teichoic acid export membrane protein
MSQLRKDTQLTLLSRIPVMLLSFLAVVLLTRLLGPEGNGVYTFVYASLNLFITILGFQLDSSLVYFLSNKEYENAKVISATGWFTILSITSFTVILTFIIFFIPEARQLFIPEDQPVHFFFLFLIISFITRTGSNLIQSALRGLFRFKAFNFYITVIQLIPVLIYSYLLFTVVRGEWNKDLLFYFKVILGSETFLLLFGIIILINTGEIKLNQQFNSYKKPIFNYSYKNLISTVGHFLNKRLDVWFVAFFKGLSSLGQYGLATQVTNFVSDALTPFNQVLLPYLSSSDQDQHKEMVCRIARLNLYIAFSIAVIIACSSWFFIPILFGNQFNEAIPASQILAIGIVFISQRLVFVNYFKATNRIRYAIQASWGGVLMTIVLDLLLIPPMGIIGASIATVLAYGVTMFFLIFHATKLLGLQWHDMLILKKDDITWLFHQN